MNVSMIYDGQQINDNGHKTIVTLGNDKTIVHGDMDKNVATKVGEFFVDYRLRQYPKGQVLILNGDEAEYVYHLTKGRVKQYDITDRGDEVILNTYKPPAFFPMSLAINPGPSPYIFEAETDIEVHQAPAKDAANFLRSNPDVLFDLLQRLYRGMDGVLGRMVQLMAGRAENRLIYELLVEARRFGKSTSNGTFTLSTSEKDLGARTGLSRETVSREMQKLKRAGLVSIGSRNIVIPDLDDLEKRLLGN